MKNFTIGKAYHAVRNGQERTFTLLKKRETAQYVLKWDNDNDPITILEEGAIKAWKKEHGIQNDEDSFAIGNTYKINKEGHERTFVVIENRNSVKYFIKWDDDDQEIITELPLLNIWTEAWKQKYGLESLEVEGDTRRNVKVQGHVKESLEKLKSEFQFKTESDVIQALIELYQEVDYYPKKFVDRLLILRR